jgi:branched-chain amino acid transport system substrate-binding protein
MDMSRRTIALAAAPGMRGTWRIAALLLGLAAPAQAAEPYELNTILSLTGTGAFLGGEEEKTLRVIETVVNNQGGINGRPIHFAIQDDTSSPVVAVQLATDVIAKHPPILVGPSIVPTCSAVMPLFVKGPVQYCFAPGVYPPPGSFTFAAGVSTKSLVIAALRYFRTKGWTRVGFIASTDASGQEGERIVDEGLALPENQGIKIVQRAYFNTTDVSAAAQMSRIKGADPQVIVVWTAGTPFGTVLHGYAEVGLTVPLITNSGNISHKQMDQYAAVAPKDLLFAATRYLAYAPTDHPDAIEQAQKLFYDAIGKTGQQPDTGPSIAWDAAWVIIDALKHIGLDGSAEKLHDYIEGLHDFTGVNGVFDFRDGNQRGLTLSSAIAVQWDGGKKSWLPVSKPAGEPLSNP